MACAVFFLLPNYQLTSLVADLPCTFLRDATHKIACPQTWPRASRAADGSTRSFYVIPPFPAARQPPFDCFFSDAFPLASRNGHYKFFL